MIPKGGTETRAVRDGAAALAANVAIAASRALNWFVSARLVGLHSLGFGSGVVSATGLAASALGMGFGTVFTRYVAERPNVTGCAASTRLLLSLTAGRLEVLLGLLL